MSQTPTQHVMTPRQRWLALLDGQHADRVPTDIWRTPEVDARLKRELNCLDDEALCRRLHIDMPHHVAPPFGPAVRCRLPHHPDDPEANIWGVRMQQVAYGTGEYSEAVHHPLASVETVAQVEAFRWPTADDFDYTSMAGELAKIDGTRIVMGGAYEPFLLACEMRGMEQAFRDLLRKPAIIEAILAHIFDFYHEHNRRIFEAAQGRIDIFYLAEDLGGQHGPLLSLQLYRRFLKPNQIRMADLARKHGARIFYHTDGAARPFLGDLIDDVGINILNPIQYKCPGMERDALVRDFGDRVVFHGAIDNQQVMPFGSVEDVREEVRRNLDFFARSRWICAPCHMIQPNTPTANIVALYDEIHRLGQA
ncbi:MAG TPA: uroporphyrinogen decarboxylase family protein [Phycisphaerae bacterium]|nr:uroporphyrinogen decarboxylase family protein [Phycisphaerae bacterium]